MLRRSLLASAIVLAGVAAYAPQSNAQTVPVPFNGTVTGGCIIGNITPGTLFFNGTDQFSTPGFGSTGGSAAQVEIDCTGPGNVNISTPSQTGGTTTFSGVLDAQLSSANIGTVTPGNTVPLPLLNDVYSVDMTASTGGQAAAPGAYTFEVQLTVTP